MNKHALRLKLARLDGERDMVLNYIKNAANESAKAIYDSTLEFIDFEINATLSKLEKDDEGAHEH